MNITLNGKIEEVKIQEIKNEIKLIDFLQFKGVELNKIVIEYNCNIVKKEEWAGIVLKENDKNVYLINLKN